MPRKRKGSSHDATASAADSEMPSGTISSKTRPQQKRTKATTKKAAAPGKKVKANGKQKKPKGSQGNIALPASGQKLLDQFVALDQTLTILAKMGIPPTVANLQRVSSQTGRVLKVQDIRAVAGLLPGVVQLSFHTAAREDPFAKFSETTKNSASAVAPNVLQMQLQSTAVNVVGYIGLSKAKHAQRRKAFQKAVAAHLQGSSFGSDDCAGAPAWPLAPLPALPSFGADGVCVPADESQRRHPITPPSEDTQPPAGTAWGVDALLEYLLQQPFAAKPNGDNAAVPKQPPVVHTQCLPRRAAQYGQHDPSLSPAAEAIFSRARQARQASRPAQATTTARSGVSHFYSHQVLGCNAVRRGDHCVVATSTGSGKSLVFSVPIVETLLEDPQATALLLYPTKALAQDQLGYFEGLLAPEIEDGIIRVDTMDGDVPFRHRSFVQEHGRIVLSNPDMLHCTVLAGHDGPWRRFLANLKYVVIDEAHTYRGAFGSHVAMVLRRLLRCCALQRSASNVNQAAERGSPMEPQVICCSATISNAREHFYSLFPRSSLQRQLCVVGSDVDGSPHGCRLVALWNPAILPGENEVEPLHWKTGDLTAQEEAALLNEARNSDSAADAQSSSAPPSSSNRSTVTTKSEDAPCKIESCTNDLDAESASTTDGVVAAVGGKFEPKGRQLPIVLWHATQGPQRRSSIYETAQLFAALALAGARTLAFCRTRKLVELVLKYTLQLLRPWPSVAARVTSYRGGYTKADRRMIEKRLFAGELLGVACTCALELGVDIGSLDATVQLGVPDQMSTLWQRAGRAGRGGRDSLSVVVLFNSPTDQFFAQQPQTLFARSTEPAVFNHSNPFVLRRHLPCALLEHGIALHDFAVDVRRSNPRDEDFSKCLCESRDQLARSLKDLVNEGMASVVALRQPARHLYSIVPRLRKAPARAQVVKDCNLRVIADHEFKVFDQTEAPPKLLNSLAYDRAFFELHPGAIYMHRGRHFCIQKLDLEKFEAWAVPRPHAEYYTEPRDHTNVTVVSRERTHRHNNHAHNGVVNVNRHVWGFRKRCLHTRKTLEQCEFSLPPLEIFTRATWIDLVPGDLEAVESRGWHFLGGVHAAQHALIRAAMASLPYEDASDLKTECVAPSQRRERPMRLVVFDATPGGTGLSDQIFRWLHQITRAAAEMLKLCPCSNPARPQNARAAAGCPFCVQLSKCSEYNAALDRRAALVILERVLAEFDAGLGMQGQGPLRGATMPDDAARADQPLVDEDELATEAEDASGRSTPPPVERRADKVAPLSPFVAGEASLRPRSIQPEWANRPNHYTS